jgi:hypothetical protein
MTTRLNKKDVRETDRVVCSECGRAISGKRIRQGSEVVWIVSRNLSNPNLNVYRCADCEDDRMISSVPRHR